MRTTERDNMLEAYWKDTEAVDRLIAESADEPAKKRFLDEMVFACARRMADFIARKYRTAVHAGTEAGDIADEMMVAYLRIDYDNMMRSGQPKAYICRTMLNAENRLWGRERTLLSCHNKISSAFREDVDHAMNQENDRIDLEKYSLSQRELLARIRANNMHPVRAGAHSHSAGGDTEGNGHSGDDSADISVPDQTAEKEYAGVLFRNDLDVFILTFFPQPMMRMLFWFLYVWKPEQEITVKCRLDTAFSVLREKFGIDREDFLRCRKDMDRIVDLNRDAMRDFFR